MTTPLLALSEIAEGVASQAALHNTALRQAEARTIRVLSRTTTAPPGSPAESDAYIIPAGATGAWSGLTNQVAAYIGAAWTYYAPIEGVALWVNDANVRVTYDGAAWAITGGSSALALQGLTFTSDTGSTADSDPGNGLFKWNHATQSSATVLYFDDLTADAVSLTTFWASLAPLGVIYIQQSDDASKWQLWKWTAAPVDGTGYRKFTVTLQASGGSIADAKTVYTIFDNLPDPASSALPVIDTTGIAKGSADATKVVRLEVDGLTTATTRVLTVQDKNGTVDLAGQPRVQAVAYAADVTLDCSLYDVFDFAALTGNVSITLSNAFDGQKVELSIPQDATGSRTIAFVNTLIYGADVTALAPSTAANKIDEIVLRYKASVPGFRVLAVSRGYTS